MAWVKFHQPFDFKATPAVTIAYKPGTHQVTSACATLAIAAGRAVRLKKTKKDEAPQPVVEMPAEDLIVGEREPIL